MREYRKISTGLSVPLLAGCIFGGVGLIYVIVAVIMGLTRVPIEALPVIFGCIGGVLLAVGLTLIGLHVKKQHALQDAYENGDRYVCQINDVYTDRSVRVNGRPMRRLQCSRLDSAGYEHIYTSGICRDLSQSLVGQDVDVYVSRDNEKCYYVDIEKVTGKTIYH